MGAKSKGDKKDEWGTPRVVFEKLDREFHFTLDPCGRHDRILKKDMITLDIRVGDDGLIYDWSGHRVFVNPPYSNHNIREWVKKAFASKDLAELIVMLIPPNVGTSYFHDYIYNIAELRFFRGRIQFVDLESGKPKNCNTQESMLAIYRNGMKSSYNAIVEE